MTLSWEKNYQLNQALNRKRKKLNPSYTVELKGGSIRMVIKRSNMSSLLVPVTVIVIGHNVDVVKVLVEHRHIVAFINDLLAGRNSGTQQKTFRLEGCTEFFDQC